ncbi:hypothetical protein JST97_12265 [bacterium]|nr:hypothetical protein [bacterium]
MFKKPEGITPEKLAAALTSQKKTEPEPAPKVQGPNLINAAVWAYGQWSSYQKQLDEQERRLLDLAYQNKGWFTQTEAVRLLGRSAPSIVDRLKEAGILEEMQGKHGQPVYVVPQFLPPSLTCQYCQAVYDLGEVQTCRQCGAVLNS